MQLGKQAIKFVGLVVLLVWCVRLCGWAPVVVAVAFLSALSAASIVSTLRARLVRGGGQSLRARHGWCSTAFPVLVGSLVVFTVWFVCGIYTVGEFQQATVRELDGTLVTVETRCGTWWHPAGLTVVAVEPADLLPSTRSLLRAARQWGAKSAASPPPAVSLETDDDVRRVVTEIAAVYQASKAEYGLVYDAWVPSGVCFSAYAGTDSQTLAGQYTYSTDTLTINLRYRKGGSWEEEKTVVHTIAHEVWHAQGEWVVKLGAAGRVPPAVLSRHVKFLDEAVCQTAAAEAVSQWADSPAGVYGFLWEACLGTAGFNVVYGGDSPYYSFVSKEPVSDSWAASLCGFINRAAQEVRTAELQQEWVETCSQLGIAEIDADTWGQDADTNRVTVLVTYYVASVQLLMKSRGGCITTSLGDKVCVPRVYHAWWQGLYEAGLPCG